jgi:cell division protein FtsW
MAAGPHGVGILSHPAWPGESQAANAGQRPGLRRTVARKLKSDKVLFTATLLLVCTGVVMIFSASAMIAQQHWDQPQRFVLRQAIWIAIGLGVLAAAMRVDYRTYRRETVVWTLVGVVGVMLVAVLFSTPVGGARRWFGIGGLGLQPAELAKLAVVLLGAWTLERRMPRIDDVAYSLLPLGVVVGGMAALVFQQPDFGTAFSLLLIAGVMVFSAGLHLRYVAGACLVGVPLLYLLLVSAPYRQRRVLAFLDPHADPLGEGYQLIQSLIAVGSGGVAGVGLMQGVQKLFYLPEPHTDFIFAVIGEELGLLGAAAMLACFVVIAWRGLRIAVRAEEPFGAFLALGLTTMIAAQAFINMSVVLGLMPTKGIPLPFVSAGGSSLLVSMLAIGVLLNVSRHQASRT